MPKRRAAKRDPKWDERYVGRGAKAQGFYRALCAVGMVLAFSSIALADPILIAAADVRVDTFVRTPLDFFSFSVTYPPDTSQGCGPCPGPGPTVLEHNFRPIDVGTSVSAD